ncbi:MAG: TraR/DksA C4-type zinc finger protein [Eubacteriaceae bacterium]
MREDKKSYFKDKLLNEKKRLNDLIDNMKKNNIIDITSEMSTELSHYDNHPADLGSEMNDRERGSAFKGNELSIINKIDNALHEINAGTYGRCTNCGSNISVERLEIVPYTVLCVKCQNKINSEIEKG